MLLWASSSALTVSIMVLGGWQFRRKRRSWRLECVCGAPVWIAPDTGPVVSSLLNPQIVLPEWIVEAPLGTQRYVVAHEQAHVAAGDSRLLALSMIVVALTPWNPLLGHHDSDGPPASHPGRRCVVPLPQGLR
jgi:hypothetical protein